MIKRDKIIEILRNNESCPFAEHTFLSAIENTNYSKIAKEILALPIDVPNEQEIDIETKKLPYTKHLDDGMFNDGQISGFEQGAKWAIDEILKRNK